MQGDSNQVVQSRGQRINQLEKSLIVSDSTTAIVPKLLVEENVKEIAPHWLTDESLAKFACPISLFVNGETLSNMDCALITSHCSLILTLIRTPTPQSKS